MTNPPAATVEAVAKIIDPIAFSDAYIGNRVYLDGDGILIRRRLRKAKALAMAQEIIASLTTQAVEPETGREGPAPIPNTRLQCFGCKHLVTKDWREPSGDGETSDSGTSARCAALPTEYGGQSIGAYWSRTDSAPKWCPFLPAPPSLKTPEQDA